MDDRKLAQLVGKNINFRRRQLGLTQEALAEKVGIGQESLSRMEKGSIAPKFERLQTFASALNCRVTDLFRTPDDKLEDKATAIADIIRALPSEKQALLVDIVARIARMSEINK
jgi:transcriptional regulator with XRE-family HTH domain